MRMIDVNLFNDNNYFLRQYTGNYMVSKEEDWVYKIYSR